jgi:hypothetical protein
MMVQDSKAGARGYFGVNFTFGRRRAKGRVPGQEETNGKSLLKSDLKKYFKPYRAWL